MVHLLKKPWDSVYLEIAATIAQQSTANRKKVGCVLVKNGQIISFGYNGTLPNENNCCEDQTTGKTKPDVIHAEANAIAKCARNGIATQDAEAYLTFSPCVNCAMLLVQAGISKVVYKDTHSNTLGLDLLRNAKILVYQK